MDLKCLIETIDGCKKNPENSSTTKVDEHIISGFSMSSISSLKIIENRHDVYRSKDCMRKFCESLREHSMKIINCKKKRWSHRQNNSRNHMKKKNLLYLSRKIGK